MHSVIQWMIQHLEWVVTVPLAASSAFLAYSVFQVQKKLQQQKQEVEREIQMMERSIRAVLSVDAGQQVTDEPKKHKDVLAPSGQNVSTPFRERATKVGII